MVDAELRDPDSGYGDVKCECWLVHRCVETERASVPLTWQGTLLFVLAPCVLVAVFVWMLLAIA